MSSHIPNEETEDKETNITFLSRSSVSSPFSSFSFIRKAKRKGLELEGFTLFPIFFPFYLKENH
jgi:hypothetical protein